MHDCYTTYLLGIERNEIGKMYICPSIMTANFKELEEEVIQLDNAGADIFHIDIMDGSYVSNFGLSPEIIRVIREATDKLLDVHLMIDNPSRYIDFFQDLGVDIIYIHPDSEKHPGRVLKSIRDKGMKAGIVLNPDMPLNIVKEMFSLVDYVMFMTVYPGFSGGEYQENVEKKIEQTLNYKEKYKFEIFIDGAVSPSVIKKMKKRGVDGFVLGTSALFNQNRNYKELINFYKKQ